MLNLINIIPVNFTTYPKSYFNHHNIKLHTKIKGNGYIKFIEVK